MTGRVLIIDGDPFVRAAAVERLGLPNSGAASVACGDEIRALARRVEADLVVLGAIDVEDVDASSLLRQAFGVPITPLFRPSVYLRPRANGVEISSGLTLGLLDCKVRIGQQLRARTTLSQVRIQWGEFAVTLEAGDFTFRGQGLGLTRAQGAILSLLMLHGGEIVSKAMIEDSVFHGKPKSQTNFIPVHISRLRAKLRAMRSGIFIENVRGGGYVLFWTRAFSSEDLPQPGVRRCGTNLVQIATRAA